MQIDVEEKDDVDENFRLPNFTVLYENSHFPLKDPLLSAHVELTEDGKISV